ncbi:MULTISPECIES: M15 family metallopeptidase [Cohnella]|uniref:M15 family metallopeptidase n=1 Tax=Cohnella TaxID=329857 RepID=UPI0009B9B15F|nr:MULTISPECIES: M15 family metallopeptidase [Cohnella]MBN2982898.1 D-alanyl-D-alanine carboxypeptidase family protein [Cohnella algarum]
MKLRQWGILAVVVAAGIWGASEYGKWNVWGSVSETAPSSKPAQTGGSAAPSGTADGAATEGPAASPGSGATAGEEQAGGGQAGSDGDTQTSAGGSLSEAVEAMLRENAPDATIATGNDGLAVVTNESSLLVLVNKKRNLPSDYVPDDLVVPDVAFSFSGDSPKKKLRKPAAEALEELFAGAEADGIELKAVSGYRSYATQKSIFERNAEQKGEEVANRTSAKPGQSEHQTGLAMDVSSKSAGYALETSFGDTKEGQWLKEHAADYGFIIRYLKGTEDITGYTYEPWHIRYVGKEIARDVMEQGVTLEQYMEQFSGAVEVSAS